MPTMSELSALERTALEAILAERVEDQDILAKHLASVSALSRNNTGGGFFTDLAIASSVTISAEKFSVYGKDVWISVEGLEFGLGMILHARDGQASFLEGYAVAPEDTSKIDFENAQFALAENPQPFLVKSS